MLVLYYNYYRSKYIFLKTKGQPTRNLTPDASKDVKKPENDNYFLCQLCALQFDDKCMSCNQSFCNEHICNHDCKVWQVDNEDDVIIADATTATGNKI